ncbi:MAG: protein arginine kinase [Clostridia bacterium]|nr:protein arginine kinase [Clostridia bacterium]
MSNWYLQSGKDSDVVMSTRIRFARNIANYKFNIKNKEYADKLENEVEEKTNEIGYGLKFIKLSNMDEITKKMLAERNIISPEFAERKDFGALLINEEENISIMVNEEDHLRIQVFSSGLELEACLNLAIELDERIDSCFNIAKSKKYGYLTACPTNVGTGMRASVMLHLPGLSKTGNIQKILYSVSKFGVEIRGIHGENTKAFGDMYQISNKQTLGITEKEIIKNLKIITEKIIEQERIARKYLAQEPLELEDKIYRNFGIIQNCKKISFKEAMDLLSFIKLGTDLGILKEITDSKVLKLYLYIKPANLQKHEQKEMDAYERDVKRAEIIKQIINEN